MIRTFSRREWLGGALSALPALSTSRPKGVIVESHVHLYDEKRFPNHAALPTYKPVAASLEPYVRFVRESKIDHVVIVHTEAYQDDHRYLEYCFEHEPSPGFFKGTCLFDPIAPETPAHIEALVKKHPGRIVALRIHNYDAEMPVLKPRPFRDRDLRDPAMKVTWRKAHSLGLAMQMNFLPYYAPQIGELAAGFPELPVIIDHLANSVRRSAAEFEGVLKLAKLPHVHMKYSVVSYSNRQDYPYGGAKATVRRSFDAFGPDRMIWGVLGHSMKEFEQAVALFDEMFDFASESDRAKIRGLNAMKLFGFRA
jgi:L-fuconolactonase